MSAMKKFAIVFSALALTFVLALLSQVICISGFVRYGMLVHECPSGTPKAVARLNAWSLRRGNPGTVELSAAAYYTPGPADYAELATLRRSTPTLELLQGDKVTKLDPKKGWKDSEAGLHRGDIVLPADLPDGDHQLRATLETTLGRVTTTVPLPVYAPAKIHLLSDRPLYEPGNLVQLRAVVMKARDLTPLDGRPGRFIVTSPSGEVMLEEKASAGRYGVVAGSFPLDKDAEIGRWSVRWTSGADQAEIGVLVEPFTLPRFRLEIEPSKPFYGRGDRPKISGRVVYSSGAPVAGAVVEATWRVFGQWPAPAEWMNGALPSRFRTNAEGRFSAELPVIPRDLIGRATLHADLQASDEAKDRVTSSVDLLLSEHAIQVEAMTELEGGLVQGYNNRVFLRAATAHQVVLSKTELFVRRAWEPSDPGTTVFTDEDGVASIQFDPGPPVNVIVPGGPRRPIPRPPAVLRTEVSELIFGDEPSLADLTAMDAWHRAFTLCSRLAAEADVETALVLRAAGDGRILGVSTDWDPLGSCLRSVVLASRLPAGRERLYQVSYQIHAAGPRLVAHEEESWPEGSGEGTELSLAHALAAASTCLPSQVETNSDDDDEDDTPYAYVWHQAKGTKVLTGQIVRHPESRGSWPAATVSCLQSKLARISVQYTPEEAAEVLGDELDASDRFGVVRLGVERTEEEDQATKNPDTVLVGYELLVSAKSGAELIGETKVLLSPGNIPPLRIRANPTLAKPGDKIEITYLRGPGFSGKLPEKPVLSGDRWNLETKLEKGSKTTHFELPADASGWFITESHGARALVYVKPSADLSLELKPERPEYRPGETAKLLLQTQQSGRPHPAAVGLFGVDESLGQLTSLPGAAELEKLRDVAPNQGPAFGVLEVAALQMGRVRGQNALEAMVLQVTGLPSRADADAYTNASSDLVFDPVVELTDHFYLVLEELYREVRRWEKEAPKDEQLLPPKLAKLWKQAVAKAKAKGATVTDAYGRELRLSVLPDDLLALTEPRAVVADGTRLPEDVEDWANWVRKERP